MGGVQIKRLHQGKHGMEIIVCNHQVPARDDTVLQIIGRNMRVRFHQRRVFQASQDGDYRHHAARIDGKTDDGTAHLVPVDLAGTMEQLVEQEVELFMLGMSQLQGKQSPKRQLVQRVFPFVAHQAEFLVHIHLILAELVCPLGDAWHIIKVLAGEQTVLRRGDQGLYLCGRTREQHGEVASAHLLIFAVGAPVVGQAVVVERLAQRVAPVSVFGSYGGGYGVRLTFADDARSVGIHDILQDACSGVVSRYEEHPVERQCGSFLIFPFLAQRVVGSLFPAVSFHRLFHLAAYLVVYGFDEEPYPRQRAFSRGGRGHDESLHTGGLPLPAVLAPHYVGEGGAQYGKRSQEQYVTLFGLFTEGDDFLQQLRPHVVLWKGRQGGIRLGAFGELFLFVGIIGNVIFHLIISRARVWKIRGCPCCPHCPCLVRAGAAGNLHSALPGQMEHGSQMYIFFIGMKRVREQCLCIFFVVFGGKGAEGEEIIASRFPAIVCDGESQLYIFNVGGSDIRACHADSFGQLPQVF